MAADFSKFNFFNRMDARARIFVVIAVVVGIVFLFYMGTRFLAGSNKTTGPSHVANAPAGFQSIQGGTLTPEYQRALEQANSQRSQQAQMTGASAVPTVINYNGGGASPNCNIICSDQSANVKTFLDDWQRAGSISPEVATELQASADKNVAVDQYAAELARLVREGKLTPEQARELLEQYKKQHANSLLQDSAGQMDNLIKNGQLPLDAANALLQAQKDNVSPSDYARMLQDLVNQGRITPEVAQQLLAQYTQQRARGIIQKSIAALNEMSRQGLIIPDILKSLVALETRMVPIGQYAAAVQQFVIAGQLTPAAATKILSEYNDQKNAIGPSGLLNTLLKKAEAEAYEEINNLLHSGSMTQDVADALRAAIQSDVSLTDYKNLLDQLVAQKKLSPEIAKLKMADYQKIKGLRDLAKRLDAATNPNDYADQLKKAVAAGLLTPDEAADLMRQYQALTAPAGAPTTGTVPTTAEFAQLQASIAQHAATGPVPTAGQFAAAQTQAVQETDLDRQNRIQALMAAMGDQAQQLIAAWQPPVMVYRAGVYDQEAAEKKAETSGKAEASTGRKGSLTPPDETGPPLVKAGTILFAVLDTTVNSDYPDSPVLATIVLGPLKGAKLLGKLVTAKGVAGQMDRIALNFTLMNAEAWDKSRNVTAYAIDPDTARNVMASAVDYHYFKRFGAIMATSFLQGYANAITTSSSTSTTGIFGTSTTHPALDPRQKMLVALGQIGQTLGTATQNWINIPPTVRVDSGVSLGILFMADVT